MIARAVALTDLVVDTNMKITAAEAVALYAAGVRVIVRYVFFGPARAGDIDATELQGLLAAGLTVVLVQHPRLPKNNVLSDATGHSDASWAIKNALAAGYDPSVVSARLHLALDMEGVVSGGNVHAPAWCTDVYAAGFGVLVYNGYACGISSAQCDALPGSPEFWCDAAPLKVRPAPAVGYALHQQMQSIVAGIGVDKNEVLKDGVLWGIAA